MSNLQDVEVSIRPTLRSRNGGLSFEIRKIIDSVSLTGWTLTDLTPLNLRKIADAIYAYLGKTVEDLENEAYMRGVEEGRSAS